MEDPSEIDLILWARRDNAVQSLLSRDPQAEFIIRKLNAENIAEINTDFPELLPTSSEIIYSINVVSSRMENKQGYKKIRLYLTPKGELLKRFETS